MYWFVYTVDFYMSYRSLIGIDFGGLYIQVYTWEVKKCLGKSWVWYTCIDLYIHWIFCICVNFLYISVMGKIEIGDNLMFAILVVAVCIVAVVGIIYS